LNFLEVAATIVQSQQDAQVDTCKVTIGNYYFVISQSYKGHIFIVNVYCDNQANNL